MSLNDNSKFNTEPQLSDDPFALEDESDFNLDQPQSDDFIDLGEEIGEHHELNRVMGCVCPKCSGITEIDLAFMPEKGFVTNCTSCNKPVHIIREACSGRAKRKSHEINCANCGKQLDQHVHCHSCGMIFPDYFITVNPEDARRQARKDFFYKILAGIKELNFTIKPSFESSSGDSGYKYSPIAKSNIDASGISKLFSRKVAILAMILIVTVSVMAGGVFTYNSYKAGQAYAENYFKLLYGLKMGVDSNLKACLTMQTEWESALASGRNFSPVVNIDETKATKLRSGVDKLMQIMNDPPKKYLQANDKLVAIHKVFLDSEAVMLSKPHSPLELGTSINSINKKMIQASQELKSNLPEPLKYELEIAKSRFRELKDF